MPLFEYRCDRGHVTEELFKANQEVPRSVRCACGQSAIKLMAVPARTPGRWGESAATWNEGLGCMVTGAQHVDKLCEERGLVPLSSLPSGHFEGMLHSQLERDAHSDRCIEALKTADIMDLDTKTALDAVAP